MEAKNPINLRKTNRCWNSSTISIMQHSEVKKFWGQKPITAVRLSGFWNFLQFTLPHLLMSQKRRQRSPFTTMRFNFVRSLRELVVRSRVWSKGRWFFQTLLPEIPLVFAVLLSNQEIRNSGTITWAVWNTLKLNGFKYVELYDLGHKKTCSPQNLFHF